MNAREKPVLIVGTGAMASMFAALFAASGLKVRMLGTWQENIKVLNEVGVRFIDQEGKEFIYSVEATDDPEKCSESRYAIVLVKSYQTVEAAQRLAKCLAPDGMALTLQNGLNNHNILGDVLGEQRVVSGVTTLGATLISPGAVRMGGRGAINIGQHPKVQPLVDLLRQADFEVELVADTSSLLWGKLVINAAINPLTALLRVPNGDLLDNPHARTLMNLITVESAEVALALEIALPYSDPIATVESVALRTASNYSSMYIDIARGSPTEIDAINGAIVSTGKSVGAPTDYNQLLWLLVKACITKSIS